MATGFTGDMMILVGHRHGEWRCRMSRLSDALSCRIRARDPNRLGAGSYAQITQICGLDTPLRGRSGDRPVSGSE